MYSTLTMATQLKKFSTVFARRRANNDARRTFFALAKRHIIKGKAGGQRDLSKKIDKIVYGG